MMYDQRVSKDVRGQEHNIMIELDICRMPTVSPDGGTREAVTVLEQLLVTAQAVQTTARPQRTAGSLPSD